MNWLMNTSIVPNPGTFEVKEISPDEAESFVQAGGWQSAIGHQGTADVLTGLLGVPVPVNRVQATMDKGDQALVFKLATRLPEGVVLTANELSRLAFSFWLMTRIA